MDASVVQFDGVDGIHNGFHERFAAPPMLIVERLAPQREWMRQRNVGVELPGRLQRIDGSDPRTNHKPGSQERLDGLAKKLFHRLRLFEVHKQIDSLFRAYFDARNNRHTVALVQLDRPANLVMIGDCNSEIAVSAVSLDAGYACDAVGIARMNVRIDEQFRALGSSARHL